jgi:plasmid stabilization system protein ParE
MALRLAYQKRALRNLDSIYRIIAEDRPRAAAEMIGRIRGRTNDLLQFPLQGREAARPGNRELVIAGTPYIVTYRIRGDEIQILMVRHGARRPLG